MRLLQENNMTRVDLAKILNVSESTVGKWILKKSMPRMGMIEDIAEYFNVKKSDILEYKDAKSVVYYNSDKVNSIRCVEEESSIYNYFPVSVSAGPLENIEAQSDCISISLPNSLLGKYAGKKEIIILKVNGESMNNIIPDGSFIVVDTSRKQVSDINDRDIVVFAENGSYSLKRYINDKNNQRFLFKPDSTDDTFTPIEVSYEESINLKLIGRVVKYVVNLY
ncbi:LexA family transcriptional regulator [Peptostreptococcus sp.]|uniref:LexA family transcriptional regulator n=1 Tax=Peptostreptococcus sp. TaxID=1262 RepID=UPI00257D0F02|nr:XRE family transcriptional regulator [Peptostreptococcus sp.]